MSRFSTAIIRAFGRDLDRTFAERVRVRHQAVGEFIGAADDPSISPFDVQGIPDLPTDVVQAAGILDGAKSELVAFAATVDFAAAQFSGARPSPVRGTMIDLVERSPVLTFQVRSAKPDGLGRIICDLAAIDV